MLYSEILTLSRQAASSGLTPWFDRRLKEQIDQGLFATEAHLTQAQQKIIGHGDLQPHQGR